MSRRILLAIRSTIQAVPSRMDLLTDQELAVIIYALRTTLQTVRDEYDNRRQQKIRECSR